MAVALTLASGLSWGCGGTKPEPQSAVEAVPTPPRDAAVVAREVVGAKIGAMIRVDRMRSHPLTPKLIRLGHATDLFEGTDVDLLRDATLAYVASTGITRKDRAVVVVRHQLDDARVRSALETVMQRSDPPGRWLEGTRVAAAVVKVRGHERVVGLPASGFVVVLPVDLSAQVDQFAGPLELRAGDGPEAVRAEIDSPSRALRARHAPRIPDTISRAEVRMVVRDDGGADVFAEGQSNSPEQAKADARTLTRSVADATSAKVAFVRVRFFRKVPFRAEGDRVKAEMKMSGKELAKILSMADLAVRYRR